MKTNNCSNTNNNIYNNNSSSSNNNQNAGQPMGGSKQSSQISHLSSLETSLDQRKELPIKQIEAEQPVLDPNSFKGLSISGSYSTRSTTSNGLTTGEICGKIKLFLQTAVPPTPNSSTIMKPHANVDLLYQLDQVSQLVVKRVVDHQRDETSDFDPIIFQEYDCTITFYRTISMEELQRHRRQFVKVNTLHPPNSSVDFY